MLRYKQLIPIEVLGSRVLTVVRYAGGLGILLMATIKCIFAGLVSKKVRIDRKEISAQMIRVGLKSLGIVCLVQGFIGMILALQMAPSLANYGQEGQIAAIIGIAGFRMMGPIITAVVLSGFAGASIAAEIGTMVVAEEIEAMNAMALNPIRFLVVPRVIATTIMMLLLTPIADMMIALGGYFVSWAELGPQVYAKYWATLHDNLEYRDFYTGLIQATVFGVLISLIACYEGLRVRGGAEGVGKATTMTVVNSIVAIILAACVFTVIFYMFKL
ncbi:MAG: ABC transporter permease [Phycisphaerae bacterium]|nr:ABC transporter permease [Phycisphaerae bacterium]